MAVEPARKTATMRVALVFDMDACRSPTGVTRHALAQLDRLRRRPEIDLRLVSGRVTEPDGRVVWESLESLPRRELPVAIRHALRWWRVRPWPPVEWWSGPVDWVYCPAEHAVPTRRARRAVTSHDVLQGVRYLPARNLERLGRMFDRAELILSVSHFNTERLLEYFPGCEGRVAYVPNAAEDLYFEPPSARERAAVRADLGLPPGVPYLLSVANFQPRKNLPRLIRAVARLPEVASGALALVLLGEGSEAEERVVRTAVATVGRRALIRMPGYRQGRPLRAAYAESTALVFPSLCESFGIPTVEAMAQGIPVALADSTGLPEVAGPAGWYFNPDSEDAIAATLASLLADSAERARRAALGRTIAATYRWQGANDRLVEALASFLDMPRRHPSGGRSGP
jgi:glycosyltransferase involved in cell wall biosynthesis